MWRNVDARAPGNALASVKSGQTKRGNVRLHLYDNFIVHAFIERSALFGQSVCVKARFEKRSSCILEMKHPSTDMVRRKHCNTA